MPNDDDDDDDDNIPTVGSSRISSSGECKSDTASDTRRFWPPERLLTMRLLMWPSSRKPSNHSWRTAMSSSVMHAMVP